MHQELHLSVQLLSIIFDSLFYIQVKGDSQCDQCHVIELCPVPPPDVVCLICFGRVEAATHRTGTLCGFCLIPSSGKPLVAVALNFLCRKAVSRNEYPVAVGLFSYSCS